MTNRKISETVKTYNKLGQKYVLAVSKPAPKARADFIKRLKKGAKVLDIGCAGGRDMKAFVNEGFQATGIDLSTVFLKIAKQEVPNGKFFKMNVLDLKFPKESFDGIWADAVLLHLERKDIPKVLANFYKILRPGGIVYVSVKYGTGSKFVHEKPFTQYKRFYTYFTKQEMEGFIKKRSFKIIQSGFLPDDLGRPDIKWVSILAQKN